MSRPYAIAPRAQIDLFEIWEYIATDNIAAADRFIDALHDKFAMLARQPLIGEPQDTLSPGSRSFPADNYVVFYRPGEGRIPTEISRVLYGARDIETLL